MFSFLNPTDAWRRMSAMKNSFWFLIPGAILGAICIISAMAFLIHIGMKEAVDGSPGLPWVTDVVEHPYFGPGAVVFGSVTFFWWFGMGIFSNRHERTGPSVFIKSHGWRRLTDPIEDPKREKTWRLAHYAKVTISNASTNELLGIKDISLFLQYSLPMPAVLRPFVGVPDSEYPSDTERENRLEGTFGDNLHLQPGESKSGTLVFIEKIDPQRPHKERGDAQLLLVDIHGTKHVKRWKIDDSAWTRNPTKLLGS